jgi:hypothetical protein
MTAAAAMRGATYAEAPAAPVVRRTRSRNWWLWSGSGALVAAALVGLFWPMLAPHPAELPGKVTNGGTSTPGSAEVAAPSPSAPSNSAPATISEPPPSTNAPAPYDVRNVRISDLATRPALEHEAPGVIGSLAAAEGKREASAGAPTPGASSGAATAPSEPTSGASSEAASPPVQPTPAQPLPLGREADAKDKAKSTLEVLADEVQGRTKRADEPAPAPGLLRSETSSRALARPAAPSSPADEDASFSPLAVRTRAALADGGENALLEAAHDVEAFLTAAPGSPYRAEALESRLRLRTRLVTLDPDLGCDDLRSALADWRREVTTPSAEMEEVANDAASHCGS